MKHTNPSNKVPKANVTKVSAARQPSPMKKEQSKDKPTKSSKYKMDFIKKDNYDTMQQKINIT